MAASIVKTLQLSLHIQSTGSLRRSQFPRWRAGTGSSFVLQSPTTLFAAHAPPTHRTGHPSSLNLRASASTSTMKPAPSEVSPSSLSLGDEGDDETRENGPRGPVAFFDVDGTILKSNVVSAFLSFKLHNMAPAEKALYVPWFLAQVPIYLALDRVDRALFNRMFYRNYRGISVGEKKQMADLMHSNYVLPRVIPAAKARIESLREQGFSIVLVTGSLDFLMEPLSGLLQCEAVFAATLKEEYGRFSGELEGEAVSAREKAEIVRRYAKERGLDLSVCHAYGDSVADLAMLETVGFPHAVRPEARLRKIAQERRWSILEWEMEGAESSALATHSRS